LSPRITIFAGIALLMMTIPAEMKN